MKNTENFKDPNQLDLFAGIVLTVEQQSQVDRNVDNINQSTNWQRNKVQQLEQLLVEAGFKKGIDFENTFKSSLETRNIKIGYGSGQFETEVTAEFYSGDIVLKGLRFVNNELKKSVFNLEINRDKVQCSAVQDQYRFIKPKTLFEKLKLFNEKAKQQFKEYQKENSLKQSVIDKYTKLYPNATITIKSDWTKYSGSFEVIEVKFESGSYIQFKLDTYNNKEYMYKKHDAEFNNLNSEELLNRFSKQTKKEALN
jgi:tRNA G46 methylase TrmB